MSQDTYLKKQWARLSKAELVDAIIDAEKEKTKIQQLRNETSDERLQTIANLQARCLTMRHQQLRQQEEAVALERQVSGLKMVEMSAQKARHFDIRNPDVKRRISELFGPSETLPSGRQQAVPLVVIHVCPKCGRITKCKDGSFGERICEKCCRGMDWPWPGEIFWRVNEDGKMEGISLGAFQHSDGDTVSITKYHQAE